MGKLGLLIHGNEHEQMLAGTEQDNGISLYFILLFVFEISGP